MVRLKSTIPMPAEVARVPRRLPKYCSTSRCFLCGVFLPSARHTHTTSSVQAVLLWRHHLPCAYTPCSLSLYIYIPACFNAPGGGAVRILDVHSNCVYSTVSPALSLSLSRHFGLPCVAGVLPAWRGRHARRSPGLGRQGRQEGRQRRHGSQSVRQGMACFLRQSSPFCRKRESLR